MTASGAPAAPTEEQIYNTIRDLVKSIDDPSLVTVKQLRDRAAVLLGLDKGALDCKKALAKRYTEMVFQDEPAPDFSSGGDGASAAGVDPMTFSRALAATAGLVLRKMPKPRFSPSTTPTTDICDLNIRDFHGHY